MDAPVVLFTIILILSGSAPDQPVGRLVPETPATEQTFVEVNLAEPNQARQIPNEPSTVLEPEITANAAPEKAADAFAAEPVANPQQVANDVEAFDLIEPLFADEAEAPISAESAPVEPAPLEATIVEAAPVDATPIESAPLETAPVEAGPIESAPVESTPIDTARIEAAPIDTPLVQSTPIEAAPIGPAPVEFSPVEAAPVESNLPESTSLESTPVESTPVASTPAAVEEPPPLPVEQSESAPDIDEQGIIGDGEADPFETEADPFDSIPNDVDNFQAAPLDATREAAISPPVELSEPAKPEAEEADIVPPLDIEIFAPILAPQPVVVEEPAREATGAPPASSAAEPLAQPPVSVEPAVVPATERGKVPQLGVVEEPIRCPYSGACTRYLQQGRR
jgi:hypothetical protein